MKQKLIKLNESHYIVVDDSEIKVGDWYTWDRNKNNYPSLCTDSYNESSILDAQGFSKFYKVTHSFGVELKGVENRHLSEVEELIYTQTIESKLFDLLKWYDSNSDVRPTKQYPTDKGNWFHGDIDEWKEAHKELVKDKLFTINDMKFMFEAGYRKNNIKETSFESALDFIKSSSKVEWDVTFENGKLKLV